MQDGAAYQNENVEFASQNHRRIQLSQLGILLQFDKVCKELDLKYYLFSGTLLGAVRHKGFIPWDDDVDVVMLRHDYDKFIRDGQKHFEDHLFIQSRSTDREYPNVPIKIRNSKTTFIENSMVDFDINHGVYIDVFPIDGAPDNRHLQRIWWASLRTVNYIGRFLTRINRSKIFGQRRLFYRGVKKFLRVFGNFFTTIYCNICKIVDIDRTNSVVFSAWPDPYHHVVYPKEWFIGAEYLEFEGRLLPVPVGYDKILKQLYGEYMALPPEDEQTPQHTTAMVDLETPYHIYSHMYGYLNSKM